MPAGGQFDQSGSQTVVEGRNQPCRCNRHQAASADRFLQVIAQTSGQFGCGLQTLSSDCQRRRQRQLLPAGLGGIGGHFGHLVLYAGKIGFLGGFKRLTHRDDAHFLEQLDQFEEDFAGRQWASSSALWRVPMVMPRRSRMTSSLCDS
jgi:hypothetical protein